jgi:hypothetical protein
MPISSTALSWQNLMAQATHCLFYLVRLDKRWFAHWHHQPASFLWHAAPGNAI